MGGFVNEAGRVNGNLNLSRCIGDLKYKQSKEVPPSQQMITAEPDITTFDISPVGLCKSFVFGGDLSHWSRRFFVLFFILRGVTFTFVDLSIRPQTSS